MTHEFNSVCNLRHVSRKLAIPAYPIFMISVSILDHLAQVKRWKKKNILQSRRKTLVETYPTKRRKQPPENHRLGTPLLGDMFSPRSLEGFHRFSPIPQFGDFQTTSPVTSDPKHTLAKAPRPLGMSVNFNCLAGLKKTDAEIEISKWRKFSYWKWSFWGVWEVPPFKETTI